MAMAPMAPSTVAREGDGPSAIDLPLRGGFDDIGGCDGDCCCASFRYSCISGGMRRAQKDYQNPGLEHREDELNEHDVWY